MSSFQDKLHHKILDHTVDVHRYEVSLRSQVLKMLDDLMSELAADIVDSGLDTPRTDWQRSRLQSLADTAQEKINETYQQIASISSGELSQMAEITGESVIAAFNDAFGADILKAPGWTKEYLTRLADGTLIEGAPSADWWARQGNVLAQRFQDDMRKGLLRGDTITELRNRVMDPIGKRDLRLKENQDAASLIRGARRNAEALVRTSAISVANAAHMDAYRGNSDLIEGVSWAATLDMRTCLQCAPLDGQTWMLNEYHPIPALHWKCFAPGTLVESPSVLRGFERTYTGDVVIVRTSAGNEVTCTPNHPILTDAGWVAAGLIKKGQKVVQRLPGDGFISPAPNAVKVKTRIEDVVCSFLSARGMISMAVPLTSKDFHGDSRNQEVAIVWANRDLPRENHIIASEHVGESFFKNRGKRGLSSLSCFSSEGEGINAGGSPLGSDVGISSEGLTLLSGETTHSEKHCLGTTPSFNSVFAEPPLDDVSGDTQALRDRLDTIAVFIGRENLVTIDQDAIRGSNRNTRGDEVSMDSFSVLADFIRETVEIFSSLIAFDEVLEVRNRPGFVGHVYNLETEGNWYVASNIITHNCRCILLPVTKSWEQLAKEAKGDSALGRAMDQALAKNPGLRASMDGPVSSKLTYEGWFDSLSSSRQEEILGPGKFKLWSQGQLSMVDMLDQRGNPLTLAELKARH